MPHHYYRAEDRASLGPPTDRYGHCVLGAAARVFHSIYSSLFQGTSISIPRVDSPVDRVYRVSIEKFDVYREVRRLPRGLTSLLSVLGLPGPQSLPSDVVVLRVPNRLVNARLPTPHLNSPSSSADSRIRRRRVRRDPRHSVTRTSTVHRANWPHLLSIRRREVERC